MWKDLISPIIHAVALLWLNYAYPSSSLNPHKKGAWIGKCFNIVVA